jgi:hypothetical protein
MSCPMPTIAKGQWEPGVWICRDNIRTVELKRGEYGGLAQTFCIRV